MQAMPRVTITQGVPRRLHSVHTLSALSRGATPSSSEFTTASICGPLTGQPHNSKSTFTWLAMGVERSRLAIASGWL